MITKDLTCQSGAGLIANPPDPALPQPSIAADRCATGHMHAISSQLAEEVE